MFSITICILEEGSKINYLYYFGIKYMDDIGKCLVIEVDIYSISSPNYSKMYLV